MPEVDTTLELVAAQLAAAVLTKAPGFKTALARAVPVYRRILADLEKAEDGQDEIPED